MKNFNEARQKFNGSYEKESVYANTTRTQTHTQHTPHTHRYKQTTHRQMTTDNIETNYKIDFMTSDCIVRS